MIKKVEMAIIIPWKYISCFFSVNMPVVCKGSDSGSYPQQRSSEIESRSEGGIVGSEGSGMAHAE